MSDIAERLEHTFPVLKRTPGLEGAADLIEQAAAELRRLEAEVERVRENTASKAARIADKHAEAGTPFLAALEIRQLKDSSMSETLLPCPFCGGQDLLLGRHWDADDRVPSGAVRCRSCKCNVPEASWNRRASPPTAPATTKAKKK